MKGVVEAMSHRHQHACDGLAIIGRQERGIVCRGAVRQGERVATHSSRLLMERMLAQEEEHADDLVNMLFAVEPHTGGSPQRLYFGDEVPGQSDAGKKVDQEDHCNMAGKRR